MKISITGTRAGMTKDQMDWFSHYIFVNKDITSVNHGAAQGVDSEAHEIVRLNGLDIDIYPANDVPSNLNNLELGVGIYIKDSDHALQRNHSIVDAGDILIGFPRFNYEELRSGTWTAIRYARKVNKPVIIVWPNGSIG